VDPRPCRILSNGGPRHALDELRSALDAAERALGIGQRRRNPAPPRAVASSARPTPEQFSTCRLAGAGRAARTGSAQRSEDERPGGWRDTDPAGSGRGSRRFELSGFRLQVAEDQSGEPRVGLPVIPSPRGWRHEAVRLQQGGINQAGDCTTTMGGSHDPRRSRVLLGPNPLTQRLWSAPGSRNRETRAHLRVHRSGVMPRTIRRSQKCSGISRSTINGESGNLAGRQHRTTPRAQTL
jgi:hypothetical protein